MRCQPKRTARKHLQRYGPAVAKAAPSRGLQMEEGDLEMAGGSQVHGQQEDGVGNQDLGTNGGLEMDWDFQPDGGGLDEQDEHIRSIYPPLDSGFESVVPPCFADKDPPYLCLTYLQTVLHNVKTKMSVQKCSKSLEMTLNVLDMAGLLDLERKLVKTLQSAKQRLGLELDMHIIQYTICPDCWKHYIPEELRELESSTCTGNSCEGTVFTKKTDFQEGDEAAASKDLASSFAHSKSTGERDSKN
ncbi:hypothetical protein V5O48_017604 [Marasmius crinis-equi]|uniref:Uncharacterized protein n=1 Tax=Marasmius crinis-equi TaxID=585013 RepID=A0ABR3ENI1_9AGAR